MALVVKAKRVSKVAFLSTVIDLVAGPDTRLLLIGDLSRCGSEIDTFPGVTNVDTSILSREEQGLWNGSSRFVSLPLTVETKDFIIRSILPRIGLKRHLWHILIGGPSGRLFVSYDNFDPNGRGADINLPAETLDALVDQGLVERYIVDPSDKEMMEFWYPRIYRRRVKRRVERLS